jgi:hypothetical protein
VHHLRQVDHLKEEEVISGADPSLKTAAPAPTASINTTDINCKENDN